MRQLALRLAAFGESLRLCWLVPASGYFPRLAQHLKEPHHCLEVLFWQAGEQPPCLLLDALIHRRQLSQPSREQGYQQTAPVRRIRPSLYVAGLFQAVQRHCHAPATETCTRRQPPRSRGSVELQHVNHLHVGQADTDLFRRLCIEKDRGGDELTNLEHNAVSHCARCWNKGPVARWYDHTARRDLAEIKALAARIAALVPANSDILEIAPGPGFLSIELARSGLNVRAVDISKTFVDIARRHAAAEGVTASFEIGNAAALPVNDSSVDFVVCRAAFKNFSEPVKALTEMRRVLRPGGIALLIDMRRDVSIQEIKSYVHRLGVGWLNRLFMMFVFRTMLIKRAYPVGEIRRMAMEAGWREPRIEESSVGFEAWLTK